jgi:hypothetical protein
MYGIYVLSFLYIHYLYGPSTGAAAQAVPSAQLLPDGFSAFGDFEVLSVHEEGDEDVVKIRKRANDPEDCDENDCLTYSGWAEDGRVDNSFVDDIVDYFPDPDPTRKRSEVEETDKLEKRESLKTGTKPCLGIQFDGKQAPGIEIFSLAWPSPASTIDVRTSSPLLDS